MIFLYAPMFFLWILFPALSAWKMVRTRRKLNFFGTLYKYGYLYNEYKDKYYYWEFIRISIRSVIGIGAAAGKGYLYIILTMSFFILLIYLIVISLYSPYKFPGMK